MGQARKLPAMSLMFSFYANTSLQFIRLAWLALLLKRL